LLQADRRACRQGEAGSAPGDRHPVGVPWGWRRSKRHPAESGLSQIRWRAAGAGRASLLRPSMPCCGVALAGSGIVSALRGSTLAIEGFQPRSAGPTATWLLASIRPSTWRARRHHGAGTPAQAGGFDAITAAGPSGAHLVQEHASLSPVSLHNQPGKLAYVGSREGHSLSSCSGWRTPARAAALSRCSATARRSRGHRRCGAARDSHRAAPGRRSEGRVQRCWPFSHFHHERVDWPRPDQSARHPPG